MNHTLITIVILTLGLLAVACGAPTATPTPVPIPTPAQLQPTIYPTVQQSRTDLAPSKCQSTLVGKITNVATGKSPQNVVVEIVGDNFKTKTVTDANGLYGFAGLCAGQYALTITPPGSQPLINPNKVTLDGFNPTKVDLPFK